MDKIVHFLVKIFFGANSLSLLLVIYLVINSRWLLNDRTTSCIVYLLTIFIGTFFCICISGLLSNDSIDGGIKSVELANDTFLPVYLSYFFVALSIKDLETIVLVFIILLLFTAFSSSIYFNPLYVFFGYNIYKIDKENGTSIYIICKKKKNIDKYFSFSNLKRINDHTFFERSWGWWIKYWHI